LIDGGVLKGESCPLLFSKDQDVKEVLESKLKRWYPWIRHRGRVEEKLSGSSKGG
jgi:hypothetical protein